MILVTTLVAGAAMSLYWIDFNLYLASLGLSTATIGLVSTIASVGGCARRLPGQRGLGPGRAARGHRGRDRRVGLVALARADRERGPAADRRLRVRCGPRASQAVQVVMAPYMTEHSEPDHRNELFAMQFAIQNVTNIVAAVLGGVVAGLIAIVRSGMDPAGPGTYRIILVIMAVLTAAGLATVALLSDDRPKTRPPTAAAAPRRAGRLPAGPPTLAGVARDHRPGPGAVRQAVVPGLPHLHRRRTGDPVPQPVRAGASSGST